MTGQPRRGASGPGEVTRFITAIPGWVVRIQLTTGETIDAPVEAWGGERSRLQPFVVGKDSLVHPSTFAYDLGGQPGTTWTLVRVGLTEWHRSGIEGVGGEPAGGTSRGDRDPAGSDGRTGGTH